MKSNLAGKHIWFIMIPLILGINMIVLSCNETSVFQPNTPTATIAPALTATITSTVTSSPEPTNTRTQTPSLTPTASPTESIPSGTPMAQWHKLPVMPGALAGEDHYYSYHYITYADQDKVRDYYLKQLPHYHWEVDEISSNKDGGYILYRKNGLDVIYIFEVGDLTHVYIILTVDSPSLYP